MLAFLNVFKCKPLSVTTAGYFLDYYYNAYKNISEFKL